MTTDNRNHEGSRNQVLRTLESMNLPNDFFVSTEGLRFFQILEEIRLGTSRGNEIVQEWRQEPQRLFLDLIVSIPRDDPGLLPLASGLSVLLVEGKGPNFRTRVGSEDYWIKADPGGNPVLYRNGFPMDNLNDLSVARAFVDDVCEGLLQCF